MSCFAGTPDLEHPLLEEDIRIQILVATTTSVFSNVSIGRGGTDCRWWRVAAQNSPGEESLVMNQLVARPSPFSNRYSRLAHLSSLN